MNRVEETSSSLPSSTTLVLTQPTSDSPVIHLKLRKPKNSRKQVSWDADTVDNEHMNKKKSKCCCIYEKPKNLGGPDGDESSENDDDECDSCMGLKKTHILHRPDDQKEEPKEDND